MMNNDDLTYGNGHEHRPEPAAQGSTLRVGLFVAAAVFFASFMPKALVAITINNLLIMAAIMSSVIALIVREHLFAAGMTRWDEAALMLGAALIAGFFVDPAAVQAALEELNALSAASQGTPQ